MYTTTGVDAIATITELRSKTSELLDHVREARQSILIQKNNEAYAVLIDWETYQRLLERHEERPKAQDRRPQQSGRKRAEEAKRASEADESAP